MAPLSDVPALRIAPRDAARLGDNLQSPEIDKPQLTSVAYRMAQVDILSGSHLVSVPRRPDSGRLRGLLGMALVAPKKREG